MTPEEQRIARPKIAEFLGWKHVYDTTDLCSKWTSPDGSSSAFIVPPDYPASLDAMQLARTTIQFNQEAKVRYLNALRLILHKKFNRPISDWDLINAEPAEHAEAFMKTNGL